MLARLYACKLLAYTLAVLLFRRHPGRRSGEALLSQRMKRGRAPSAALMVRRTSSPVALKGFRSIPFSLELVAAAVADCVTSQRALLIDAAAAMSAPSAGKITQTMLSPNGEPINGRTTTPRSSRRRGPRARR